PEHVNIGRVDQTATDRSLKPAFISQEAVWRALPGHKLGVAGIAIGRQQASPVRICTRYQDRGNIQDVSRKSCCNQFLHKLMRGNQYLAAEMSALLGRGELVLKMDPGGAGFDHGLHQLKGVER